MRIINWRYCRFLLHRLRMRLNWFFGRYVVSGELRHLRKRVKELEAGENQDIKFLHLQLTKLRADNTELQNRADSWREDFSALLNMPLGQLRALASSYEVWENDSKGWFIALEHCVFCGCALEIVPFPTERDALLYVALLQTVGCRPKHNLSCSPCCHEYEETKEISIE